MITEGELTSLGPTPVHPAGLTGPPLAATEPWNQKHARLQECVHIAMVTFFLSNMYDQDTQWHAWGSILFPARFPGAMT